MRTFTVLTCLAVASVDADPPVASDLEAAVPGTELRGSTKVANETTAIIDDALRSPAAVVQTVSSTDAVCALAQKGLQSILAAHCNISNVACVYCKNCLKCDDWCNPSADCGFVQDNPFVKFHDYECSVSYVSTGKVDGTVTCKPEFTPAGVGTIIVVALLAVACCSGFTWWCCRRRR